jgi:RNA polymerase sigma factor (TIGR02999 family)
MQGAKPGATEILSSHLDGDPLAASRLLPLIYDDLRTLAAQHLRGERAGHSLQATALVHETWLRLIDCERIDWQGKTHFFAMAATMLRRVLVDHARTVGARKRGGGAGRISLGDVDPAAEEDPLDVLALDEALESLARASPRQARVVELRYFAGLGLEETARALDVSVDTVKSDWRFARAWLNRELTRDRAQE